MTEIQMPMLTKDEIVSCLREHCHVSDRMIDMIDWSFMESERINPEEARRMLLISWSFLRREDRHFIFPCWCSLFVPHVHDTVTGCSVSGVVYEDEWHDYQKPVPMQEGVSYAFSDYFEEFIS